jgi:hypothetical protein
MTKPNHKEEIVATRFTKRQLERLQRAAQTREQTVGEFLRLAALRAVERVERTNGT